jgi:hypothetical protein
MIISNGRVLLPLLGMIMLYGCEGVLVTDTQSLLAPRFTRSEVLGLIAGFGTTFAAVPDLIAMLRRRSSAGMNPKDGGDHGRLPDPEDLVRTGHRFETLGALEYDYRGDKRSYGGRVSSLCAPRTGTIGNGGGLITRAAFARPRPRKTAGIAAARRADPHRSCPSLPVTGRRRPR